jgi:hypothetical protein
MVEFEADEALASAVKRFQNNKAVDQIVVRLPDKDLAQLVAGQRIVCWDRRRDVIIDEAGIVEKFGVKTHSIPDWSTRREPLPQHSTRSRSGRMRNPTEMMIRGPGGCSP